MPAADASVIGRLVRNIFYYSTLASALMAQIVLGHVEAIFPPV